MASFLRRKSKQEPPKQPIVISSPAAPTPTPLFAKFATTGGSHGQQPTTRMVSSPMTLASGARRENSVHGGGRYGSSSVSVASSGKDRRFNGGAPPSSFPMPIDKPLPSNPTPASPTRSPSNRNIVHTKLALRSRTSLNIPDDKPLPVPTSSAAGRKLSVQTDYAAPPPAPLENRAGNRSPVITNLMDDEFDLTPTVEQPREPVNTNGDAAQRMSYAPDLPPEFALYQEYGAASSSPPDRSTPSDSGRAFPPQKSTGRSDGTYTAPSKPSVFASASQPANMGNNTSALNGHANSLYPSAIGSFQTSRAFVNPAQSTSMPQFNAGPSKPSFRRPGPASSPPPPPPGAAAPVPGSIYQPTSVPTQVAPIVQGKPRIFAAMGNVDEADPPKPVQNFTANVSQPYPSNQSPNQRPVQATTGYSPPTTTTVSYSNGHHPVDVQRTPRMSEPRPLPQSPPRTPQHHQQHNGPGIQSPPRSRKLSKVRQPSDVSTTLPNVSSTSIMSASVESLHSTGHGKVHQHNGHRTLAKSQPVPLRPTSSSGHKRSLSRSPTKQEQLQQQQQQQQQQQEEQPAHVDEETIRKAGIPLDDDPFAKVEGVKMLKPSSSPSKEGSIKRHRSKGKDEVKSTAGDDASSTVTREDQQSQLSVPRDSTSRRTKDKDTIDSASVAASATSAQTSEERRRERRERRAREKEERKAREREAAKAAAAAQAEAEAAASRASDNVDPELEGEIEPVVDEELEALNKLEEKFFPLTQFIGNPQLLGHLLSFMTFYDWCILSSISREIRIMLVQSAPLREEVLERFLRTVGYSRWTWEGKDPLSLSLQDLADYMRGVSTPSHEYARVAKMYVHSLTVHPSVRDPSLEHTIRCLTASTRAYTRVVLRLRAQAEKEASVASANPQRAASVPPHPPSAAGAAKAANNGYYGNMNGYSSSRSQSRPSSRAPSPTMSNYSHSYASSQYGHSSQPGLSSTTMMHQNSSQTSLTFRSPLFRLRRAPLLRVFVPSPEGDWLSDKSVLDCEAECKKAGVLHLMRMGDVVWDIAVGDEGNVGRLVYDGKYLIDLDYTYNPIGDLPKYIPTLAFPPSYFHRVIRTGPVTSNPIAHIDISPWGEEIAANLQLLQDRVKTETPQGAYHNVVRWVHRSSFAIRPPARVMQRGTSVNGRAQPHTPRIPIPETDNLFIDSGWYGTIVVETEGTNEALADLQERCGPRAFPPRPKPLNPAMAKAREENRKVFRILREKSRPGEIWIRAVSIKERLL